MRYRESAMENSDVGFSSGVKGGPECLLTFLLTRWFRVLDIGLMLVPQSLRRLMCDAVRLI